MKPRDRELGLGRAITRRDFVNGVGLGLTGSLLYPWAEAYGAPGYPPAETGMRGSHVGSFEVAHALTHGERWDEAGTGESYDLVVGGGISGLSAAYLYQKQVGKRFGDGGLSRHLLIERRAGSTRQGTSGRFPGKMGASISSRILTTVSASNVIAATRRTGNTCISRSSG